MMRMVSIFLSLILAQSLSARTLILDGKRPARAEVPSQTPPPEGFPLMLFLHGYSGNAGIYESYLNVSNELNRLGFVSLLPEGLINSLGQRYWNATPECCDFDGSQVDDVAYLNNLIEQAKAEIDIDAERIYVMGHSNGGFMAYRLACEIPEKINGIVSIAGNFFNDASLCKNPTSLNVLQIHGDRDQTVPYQKNEVLPGAQVSLDFWAEQAACGPALTLASISELTRDSSVTTLSEYRDCQARIGLWTVENGSHTPNFNTRELFERLVDFIDQ